MSALRGKLASIQAGIETSLLRVAVAFATYLPGDVMDYIGKFCQTIGAVNIPAPGRVIGGPAAQLTATCP